MRKIRHSPKNQKLLSVSPDNRVKTETPKSLATKGTIEAKVAAYESIQSSGSPSLSSSAPDQEKMDFEIPTNFGWQVQKVIVLMAFEPVINDQ